MRELDERRLPQANAVLAAELEDLAADPRGRTVEGVPAAEQAAARELAAVDGGDGEAQLVAGDPVAHGVGGALEQAANAVIASLGGAVPVAEQQGLAALVVEVEIVMAVLGPEGLEPGGSRGRSAGEVVARFGDLPAGARTDVLARLDRGEPHDLGDRCFTLGLAGEPRAARDLPPVARGQDEVAPTLGLAAVESPDVGGGVEDRFDLLVARESGGEAAQVEQHLAALTVDVGGEEAVAGAVQQLEAGLLGPRARLEVVAHRDLDGLDGPRAAPLRLGEVDDAEPLDGARPLLQLGEAGVGLGRAGAGDPAREQGAVLAPQGEVIAVALDLQGGVDTLAQAGDHGLDRALHGRLVVELDAVQADAVALEEDLERERFARLLDDTEVHEARTRGEPAPGAAAGRSAAQSITSTHGAARTIAPPPRGARSWATRAGWGEP
ncbi:hypothetical protein [Nannocystis radixulma]|uniref:Uncharacterized protein n=1 Tax=Nannocystis radixulma TaxID=2995305 RepID=A0ABT5BC76_9BACT|nr:hypothetical protein [Nannocystis radixulma]MDC0670672.1 hypothetical protein [Nannocystis radixulma]